MRKQQLKYWELCWVEKWKKIMLKVQKVKKDGGQINYSKQVIKLNVLLLVIEKIEKMKMF